MATKFVKWFGLILLVVGVVGFFNHPVLGIFEVDTVHNVIHIVSGLLAIVSASKGEAMAKTFGKIFGLVYGLVAVLGFMSSDSSVLGLITVNAADNWLHVALAIVFLGIGFMGKKGSSMSSMGPSVGMNQPM